MTKASTLEKVFFTVLTVEIFLQRFFLEFLAFFQGQGMKLTSVAVELKFLKVMFRIQEINFSERRHKFLLILANANKIF